MTITLDNSGLSIGVHFVDCVAGQTRSHGCAVVGGVAYQWRATVDCAAAESALRKLAASEGKRVSLFTSQAVA